jgi:predicted 2-oxoglutarate/Fe(II)-dependent dioxygenase YbiX
MYYAQYCRLNVHVSAPDLLVARKALRQMIKPHSRRSRDMRQARHIWVRSILREHHDAQSIVREFRL